MQVDFYNCGDPAIKIGKTLNENNFIGSTSVSPNPTGPVNVVNPVLIVDKDRVPANANYCYIPAYGRYYFITSIDWTVANTATVNCHCDVLTTFGSKIKAATMNFVRGSAKITEVEDGSYPLSDVLERYTFNFDAWNNSFFTDNSSGKRFLLRIADGRPRAYGNSVPHATVGDWLVYNGKAFEITGTWNAASIDGPHDVPVPPPSNLIGVSVGSTVTISGGDPVQYQDYEFWEQFQYGVQDPYYQLRIKN